MINVKVGDRYKFYTGQYILTVSAISSHSFKFDRHPYVDSDCPWLPISWLHSAKYLGMIEKLKRFGYKKVTCGI